MSNTIAKFSPTFWSSRAVVTAPTRRATVSPNWGASGTLVGNGKSARILFIMSAALLAIGADGPPDALDPAANRTRIVVIRGGKDGSPQPIVALANPMCTQDPDRLQDTFQGILARELIRQAILIAARDELGMATRDEVLGDVIAADAIANSNVELATVFHTAEGKPSPAVILQAEGANSRTLFRRDLGDKNLPVRDLSSPVEIAEILSRTDFPAVLKQLGIEGKPNRIQPDAGLPAGVEDRLSHLGFIDLFAAVRDIHEAIRTSGESPARVGGLVRGYTLLGAVTEHLWHPAHKVLKARALLYAQRLIARDPKSSYALWHRAFAEALIGLHKAAQADFAEARAGERRE